MSLDTPMKICSGCLENKPLSEFRRYTGGRSIDGLRPRCSSCLRAYETDYRKRRKRPRVPASKIYARQYRASNRAFYLVGVIRNRCQKKGIEFSLDIVAIQARMDLGLCEMTGYPLDLTPLTTKHERRPNTPSIDRINPKLGYTMDNVRIVCFAVNMAMSDWGETAFLPIARAWVAKAGA